MTFMAKYAHTFLPTQLSKSVYTHYNMVVVVTCLKNCEHAIITVF